MGSLFIENGFSFSSKKLRLKWRWAFPVVSIICICSFELIDWRLEIYMKQHKRKVETRLVINMYIEFVNVIDNLDNSQFDSAQKQWWAFSMFQLLLFVFVLLKRFPLSDWCLDIKQHQRKLRIRLVITCISNSLMSLII